MWGPATLGVTRKRHAWFALQGLMGMVVPREPVPGASEEGDKGSVRSAEPEGACVSAGDLHSKRVLLGSGVPRFHALEVACVLASADLSTYVRLS